VTIAGHPVFILSGPLVWGTARTAELYFPYSRASGYLRFPVRFIRYYWRYKHVTKPI
jgi:hypothetical protein